MADDPIRSQLPNDNYRKGWDETFGKKKQKIWYAKSTRENVTLFNKAERGDVLVPFVGEDKFVG